MHGIVCKDAMLRSMNNKEIIASVFGIAAKVIVAILVVMFVYKYARIGYDYGYRLFGEGPVTTGEGRTVSVSIPEDTSAKNVGAILEQKGLIRDADLFVLQEMFSDYKGQVKPGIYELNTSMTAEEMLQLMSVSAETEENEEADLPEEDEKEEEFSGSEDPLEYTNEVEVGAQ